MSLGDRISLGVFAIPRLDLERALLTYGYEVPKSGVYRHWCLIGKSSQQAGLFAAIDGASPALVDPSELPDGTVFFWSNIGDVSLNRGRHNLKWTHQGPGLSIVAHCYVLSR